MEIPENTCNHCYDEITNPHQIKKGLCHNCLMVEIGRNDILTQPERLKKGGFNKHKRLSQSSQKTQGVTKE